MCFKINVCMRVRCTFGYVRTSLRWVAGFIKRKQKRVVLLYPKVPPLHYSTNFIPYFLMSLCPHVRSVYFPDLSCAYVICGFQSLSLGTSLETSEETTSSSPFFSSLFVVLSRPVFSSSPSLFFSSPSSNCFIACISIPFSSPNFE